MLRIATVLLALVSLLGCNSYALDSIPKEAKVIYSGQVKIIGPITEHLAVDVAGHLGALDNSDTPGPILLVIDSPGGDIDAGQTIIDAMHLCKNHKVYTLDIGEAQSMAAMIFEYGDYRIMWPHAFLMFHDAHMGAEGTPEQAASKIAFWSVEIDRIEHDVSSRMKVDFATYKSLASHVWLIPADVAGKSGFTDYVKQ